MALFLFRSTYLGNDEWLAKMVKSPWRFCEWSNRRGVFVAFRDKQCSRPTCHRAAQALLGLVAGLVQGRFEINDGRFDVRGRVVAASSVALTAIICTGRLLRRLILSVAAARRSSSMKRARARAATCVIRR